MNVAQLTGMVVTAIIVFGTDMDTIYAMPLGIMAGALAMLFSSLSDLKREPVKVRIRNLRK
ncbi:MAG TPA: hypothetical protein VHL34_00320 [Rhizomicrobium sp.]|jgi:hypothetical protein|nr:hypothetical protein [Rhizomicrobium sp.]